MTEVEKVSIGGYAFTLEAEAYAMVKQYLDELNQFYSQREGGAEVMEGFEERMAELLYEKCADDGVATEAEVREIIAVLGKPSAIEAEDGPEPKRTANPEQADKPREKKRLFRDPTNKMLGGVCSGLAAYFDIDVTLIRILFLAAFFCGGFGFWLYIIIWIVAPKALTPAQKCELRGWETSAENLAKFTDSSKK